MALRGFRDRSHWEGFSQRLGLGARGHGRAQHLGARRVGGRGAGVGAAGERAAGEVSRQCRWSLTTGTATGRARARAVFKDTCRRALRAHRPAGLGAAFLPAREPAAGGDPGNRDLAQSLPSLRPARRSAGAGQRAHFAALGEELPAPGRAVPPDAVARHLHRRAERAGRRALPLHRRQHAIAPTWWATSSSISACRRTSKRRARELRRLLGMDRPVWVAGSTHAQRRRRAASPRIASCARATRRRCWCWCRAIRRDSPKWPTPLRAQGVNFVTRTSGAADRGRHRGLPGRHAGRAAAVLRRRRRGLRRRQPGVPSADTTCSSPPRSACRCWPGPTTSIRPTSRACWSSAARCASCTTPREARRGASANCWPTRGARQPPWARSGRRGDRATIAARSAALMAVPRSRCCPD